METNRKSQRTELRRRMREALRDTAFGMFDPMERRVTSQTHRGKWTWVTLGEALLVLFIIQTITGILLSLYYHPSPELAYESVKYILTEVHFGRLLHSMHYWASQAMLVTVFAHLVWSFFTAAFRAPREFIWIIGVLLMVLVVAFSFTGHLLPWDEGAFGTSVVGTEMLGRVPVVGHLLTLAARGGDEVGGPTLSRFYSLHILILPWLFFYLGILHFLMIRKQGKADAQGGEA